MFSLLHIGTAILLLPILFGVLRFLLGIFSPIEWVADRQVSGHAVSPIASLGTECGAVEIAGLDERHKQLADP